MRVVCVGDLHGKDVWKDIDANKYDKIVFQGDYVDDFHKTNLEISKNLKDIIDFKKANPEKVELLLGNHDFQYIMDDGRFICSGYRHTMASTLKMIFNDNKSLFKVAHQEGSYLFTHAGIRSGWYAEHEDTLTDNGRDTGSYAEQLNAVYNTSFYPIIWQVSKSRGGWSKFGGPMWADKSETFDDNFPVHQIVGHSKVKQIITMPRDMELFKKEYHENADFFGTGNKNGWTITYTDCLDTEKSFYELEI